MSHTHEELFKTYEKEHATTLRVLRAFPADKADLRPHPKCKTAKELAWVFVLERGLATRILKNEFSQLGGASPEPPEKIEDVITALEAAQRDFMQLLRSFTEEQMHEEVTFFVAPKTPGPLQRDHFAWLMLHDEIHHRGQFSIYLRIADAKVPSIYGPTADEPWM
jgi:uncharacterized damage-inducible protein DinB